MKKAWLGVFAALTMFGSAACSSSSGDGTAPGKDGSVDTATGGGDTKVPGTDATGTDTLGRDVSRPDTPGTDTSTPLEGTTGKPCTTDDECDVTGSGVNSCGNAFAIGTLFPTPVCIGRGCDIGDGTSIMGCDGDLGVCLDDGASGICLGACGFKNDGAAPSPACAGKDACQVLGWGKDSAGVLSGVGYCFGGCTADTDCTKGDKCQKESGLCVKTPIVFTKAVGDACTDLDAKAPAKCECLYLTTTKKGYCSSFCKVGDAATACPTGFTCSPGLPTTDSTDGSALFSMDPAGIGANCLKNCTTDADCTAINSECRTTASGKVCYPKGV
jgi:hypothetical protein